MPASVACALLALFLVGCGASRSAPSTTATTGIRTPTTGTRTVAKSVPLTPTHCPAGVPNCASASGRIVYVEAVDPDGDGDAHFVLASRESVTAPGISAIDVAVDLRPHPLPGIGDRMSAAGPVQTGSYGQHQIHAVALHVARLGS